MKTEYMEAVGQFEWIVELDASHFNARGGLGIAHKELRNFLDVIIAFERLLELDSGDQLAQEMLRQLREIRYWTNFQ